MARPLPRLADLRAELERGLTAAILASASINAPAGLDTREATEAARAVIAGRGLPEPLLPRFADRPVCALVSFDADRIQQWVFASQRVQVAKGASLTLDRLNQSVRERASEIPGIYGVVYSAGGGGMLFAAATPAAARAATTAADLHDLELRVRACPSSKATS
jgi:hypothetical protein